MKLRVGSRESRLAVVQTQIVIGALRRAHPYAGALETAPLAIVLCGQPQGADWFDDYWQQDCGACAENMLLAATALEYVTGWAMERLYPDEARCAAFREILALPREVEPFCALAFGHPAEEGKRPDRYDPALIHRNRW